MLELIPTEMVVTIIEYLPIDLIINLRYLNKTFDNLVATFFETKIDTYQDCKISFTGYIDFITGIHYLINDIIKHHSKVAHNTLYYYKPYLVDEKLITIMNLNHLPMIDNKFIATYRLIINWVTLYILDNKLAKSSVDNIFIKDSSDIDDKTIIQVDDVIRLIVGTISTNIKFENLGECLRSYFDFFTNIKISDSIVYTLSYEMLELDYYIANKYRY